MISSVAHRDLYLNLFPLAVVYLHAAPQEAASVEDAPGDVKDAATVAEADAEAGGQKPNSSLSFTPFTLAFRNIKYHVPKPAGKVWTGVWISCCVFRPLLHRDASCMSLSRHASIVRAPE